MRTRKLTISDVIIGRRSHVPIVTIAVPLINREGRMIGVGGASLDLSRFHQFVDEYRTLEDATVTIVDQHHRVIYSSPHSGYAVLQNLDADGMLQASAKATGRTFRYTRRTAEGSRGAQLVAGAAVESAGWRVFVEQPLLNMRLQSMGYYALTLALILMALGGAVLGAQGFAGAVSVPAAVLTAYAAAICDGLLAQGIRHVCLVNNHLEPAHAQEAAAPGIAKTRG